ncbi:SusC/RagA family TonB-linked outer membrane protein [Pseudobacter ginsenosidimutans]|uniref:TonB-dependent receptor-like protein n=1 Tax=Pseudobacter ginsenosidimutans TaxID=661488 RepID=A0A4Q7MKN9_9BACT|nr:SusC/RagA family TonB-linked outer membrane protein [Pseudobacter ginsenosidimutans]QEC45602.1 hypothetical protein FSB84_29390 [Pseudobacter ginsenosidimutans]RZS67149.1 TonB-dependent receptor-like protein [Pseudobacter ginsenosidimutans]
MLTIYYTAIGHFKDIRRRKGKPIPLLIILLMMISARGAAQEITLKGDDLPLKKIFAEIKKQTGYTFFFDADLLEKGKKVSLNVKSAPLKAVLDLICKDQPFTYSIEGKIIFLHQIVEKKSTESPQTDLLRITVMKDTLAQGRVRNPLGIPLIGVTVTSIPKNGNKKLNSITNGDGRFEIPARRGDKLQFTSVGYGKEEIRYNGEANLEIVMKEEAVSLGTVQVSNQDFFKKKIPWTDTISMTNRRHMTLGQVLQGTIPGLTLQSSSQSQTVLESIDLASSSINGMNVVSYNDLMTYYNNYWKSTAPGRSFQDMLEEFKKVGYKINNSTSVNNNGLIPQLRGVSGFNGNVSGMLIVIDGFVQNGFQSDYPMNNVESVKVIKNPEELARWGPRAAGGIILITTRKGVEGKLDIDYNTNFYYAASPHLNRNKQRLASSADLLDYLKAASDSGFLYYSGTDNGAFAFNRNPAELLLFKLKSGAISQQAFDVSWDSLSRLSNQTQLKLLQQDIFQQRHTLRIAGGKKHWQFSATGNLSTSRNTAYKSKNSSVGLNLSNRFNFFNSKLRADWQVIVTHSKADKGFGFDPTNTSLMPYQLLLNGQGDYVYDYSRFSPDANAVLMNAGYENHGINLLQDARVNSNIQKNMNLDSRLMMEWELLPGLLWTSAVQTSIGNSELNMLQGAASSQTRQLLNDYATPIFNTNVSDPDRIVTGLFRYVPKGDVLRRSFTKSRNWDLRSGLVFNKKAGKHEINAVAGGGGSSNVVSMPTYSTIYGYDPGTGKGQNILLPLNPLGAIGNYYQLRGVVGLFGDMDPNTFFPVTTTYPYTLLTPNAGFNNITRQLGWNASVRYAFDQTIMLSGRYNTVLSPNYGYDPPYVSFSSYNGEAAWRISRYKFLELPEWISDISVSSGITGIEMPRLPVQITADRSQQTNWNNFGIWVNSYNVAQQTGQNTRNKYEKLTVGILNNRLVFDLTFNKLQIEDNTINKTPSSSLSYFGANAKLRLRNNLLNIAGGIGKSPEGRPQFNMRAGYDIGRETWFNSISISSLLADFTLQHISPFQGMALMMETNTPDGSGGYSMVVNNNFGFLQPDTKILEAHASIGFLQERYLADIRYYQKRTSGLNNNIPVPTDPSTGLGAQVSYSELVSSGVELKLELEVIRRTALKYLITLNGSYNNTIARNVPLVNFSQTSAFLNAFRNGYSTDNIWSYRWAGLDNQGRPQIYDQNGQKTATPDSATLASALIYSGVIRAPFSVGLIQRWDYKAFFAGITVMCNWGHVMREYIPSPSGTTERSILIRDRWRQPGDEAHTDIAAMANTNDNSSRTFIIQNASNSIMSADNIRLQEMQIGWHPPKNWLKKIAAKEMTLSVQVQNAFVITRNRLHVDPETVSTGGQIGLAIPRLYSFTMEVNF